jgi:hypothetical protein
MGAVGDSAGLSIGLTGPIVAEAKLSSCPILAVSCFGIQDAFGTA